MLGTDWSGLFLQEFTGDVTILPPLRFGDYMRMLADPTVDDMRRYLQVGQIETWRKLPMLKTRLRIAHALQALQARVVDSEGGGMTVAAGGGAGGGAGSGAGGGADGGGYGDAGRLSLKRSDSTLHF